VKTTNKSADESGLKSPGHGTTPMTVQSGGGAQVWAEPIITSTPARPKEIALTQGLLSSPDSDYSTDSECFLTTDFRISCSLTNS